MQELKPVSPEKLILPGLAILTPTAEQEWDYVFGELLAKLSQYRKKRYRVTLPQTKLFNQVQKEGLDAVDLDTLKKNFYKHIFDPNFYTEGYEKLVSEIVPIWRTVITIMQQQHSLWTGFQLYPDYQIRLTS